MLPALHDFLSWRYRLFLLDHPNLDISISSRLDLEGARADRTSTFAFLELRMAKMHTLARVEFASISCKAGPAVLVKVCSVLARLLPQSWSFMRCKYIHLRLVVILALISTSRVRRKVALGAILALDGPLRNQYSTLADPRSVGESGTKSKPTMKEQLSYQMFAERTCPANCCNAHSSPMACGRLQPGFQRSLQGRQLQQSSRQQMRTYDVRSAWTAGVRGRV